MLKIIRDTREKEGYWDFTDAEVVDKTLQTGDYSILGLEDYICIERKKSTSEVAINLGKDLKRFSSELERMKLIPLSYIICEFTLQQLLQFPKGTNINPKLLKDVKINGKYLVKTMSSFKDIYNIEIIYAGNRENAIMEAERLFEMVKILKGME